MQSTLPPALPQVQQFLSSPACPRTSLPLLPYPFRQVTGTEGSQCDLRDPRMASRMGHIARLMVETDHRCPQPQPQGQGLGYLPRSSTALTSTSWKSSQCSHILQDPEGQCSLSFLCGCSEFPLY